MTQPTDIDSERNARHKARMERKKAVVDAAIAAATGTRGDEDVVVVCSVGVDLEAVVLAADTRLAVAPDATLLLALPARDVLPVTQALVDDLRVAAEVVPVPGDWQT